MKNFRTIVVFVLLILVIISCSLGGRRKKRGPNNIETEVSIDNSQAGIDKIIEIAESVNKGEETYAKVHINITKDLDLTTNVTDSQGRPFIGLGTYHYPFQGSVNGRSNKVKIYVNGDGASGFIRLLKNGAVSNLTVAGESLVYSKGTGFESTSGAGMVVGYAENSRIENCSVDLNAKVDMKYAAPAGAVVGRFKVTEINDKNIIIDCKYPATDLENITAADNNGDLGPKGAIVGIIEGGVKGPNGTIRNSVVASGLSEVGEWRTNK